MATAAMTALATFTVTGSAAAALTISSLPTDYKDLMIVIDGNATPTETFWEIKVNSDSTTSNYYNVYAQGNGSSDATNGANNNTSTYMRNTSSNNILHFFDYTATDKNKTMLGRANSYAGLVQMVAWMWNNTNAITSIELYDAAGDDFAVGTTLSVYGIKGEI